MLRLDKLGVVDKTVLVLVVLIEDRVDHGEKLGVSEDLWIWHGSRLGVVIGLICLEKK